ncbi:hypothetical protein M413DRAFT_356802 [Hebeloma cylindrosporum]|uniref:Uncharacterized protein n=1 Tax=Hebeloma cylindrosporum TaxID=76867 RepID=A0A0C3CLD4_HEBCY|nr:hypothetical protein M413DRAFT_356802 [Hebeloma cylindrosporum h7]
MASAENRRTDGAQLKTDRSSITALYSTRSVVPGGVVCEPAKKRSGTLGYYLASRAVQGTPGRELNWKLGNNTGLRLNGPGGFIPSEKYWRRWCSLPPIGVATGMRGTLRSKAGRIQISRDMDDVSRP